MDEVLTWDSFDLTEEANDTSIDAGDGYVSGESPVSGLHGYMCALASYAYDNDNLYGFTTFYLHNKERTKSRPSKSAARAPGMEQIDIVDGNEVTVPVLRSDGTFCIATYAFYLNVSATSGNAFLAIGTTYDRAGGDNGDGIYSRTDYTDRCLKPVVYYKAF